MSKTKELQKELVEVYGFDKTDVEGKHYKKLEKMLKDNEKQPNATFTEKNKPKRRTKKDLARNMLVPVANYTDGRLIYKSRKTGAEWDFSNFGMIDEMELSELISMKSSYPRYLQEPYLFVLDDEVVEFLGLKNTYEKLLDVDEVDTLFRKNNDELEEFLNKAPSGLQKLIIGRAKQLIKEGRLDSMVKKELIEDTFNVDLEV